MFDPKAPGTIQVILAQDDPSYYESRAMEMIAEAKAIRINTNESEMSIADVDAYNSTMISAIRMLLIAQHSFGG